jgi:hypothetical protein
MDLVAIRHHQLTNFATVTSVMKQPKVVKLLGIPEGKYRPFNHA